MPLLPYSAPHAELDLTPDAALGGDALTSVQQRTDTRVERIAAIHGASSSSAGMRVGGRCEFHIVSHSLQLDVF